MDAKDALAVDDLAERLLAQGWQLATAESCTGGLVASACVAVAGSSRWFAGGVVSYTAALKERLLGVPADLISQHGVVSEPVAAAMVTGLLARTGADIGVSVTGLAGPGGAEPGLPVGTVCFGWARHRRHGGAPPDTRRVVLDGDRAAVREAATAMALQGLLELLA